MFKQSLVKLREEVVKANSLVREANTLSEEMGKCTEFHVTLQIPASNLSPNRRVGGLVDFFFFLPKGFLANFLFATYFIHCFNVWPLLLLRLHTVEVFG